MERASATAAYEQELEAMPKRVASVRFLGESPPSAFAIVWCDTTAWTIPERVKPRMRGQRISQNMLQAIYNASAILVRIAMMMFLPCLRAMFLLVTHPPGVWVIY